MGTETQTGLV
uniref:Uncharacterized protein n=1 Tax=Anguilla anguilla TaxID=7936 RepID=A0A0E9UPK0_ANGAN